MSITSIDILVGGAPVHVTVDDQNGSPLSPANISWSGLPSEVSATADDTGFMFAATAVAAPGPVLATATYVGPRAAAPVSGVLTVNIDAGVTSLTFTSP